MSRAQGNSEEGRVALSELCEAYYEPVFHFLRREGRDEDEARELTQEFFEKLLKSGIVKADQRRGRFRSYLLGAVKHFLLDQRKKSGREKRGGKVSIESFDEADAFSEFDEEAFTPSRNDTWFDRAWALNVMKRGLQSVEANFEENGKSDQFQVLKHWLTGGPTPFSQADAALKLGRSESAIKVSVHRLRKQFGEAIRREISQTISDDVDLDGELRYLVEVLSET